MAREEEELYRYAYELFLAEILNIVLACLIGVIFHSFLIVFIFWISYRPLRTFAGGYHADTNWMCMVVSVLNLCMVCLIVKNVVLQWIPFMNGVCAVLCGSFLFIAAPVEDKNKHLDDKERLCYRKRCRTVWFLETAIWVVSFGFGLYTVSLTIALSHLTLAIMLVAGILKNYLLKNTLGEQE